MTDTLNYGRLAFDLVERLPDAHDAPTVGDRRDGAIYAHDHDPGLRMALEVALLTGRPLLLRGPPGCGKSTFALAVARRFGWRYYEHVVTSRTEAGDLLYRFDTVRRLADATAKKLKPVRRYIEPGPLWWALSPDSAGRYGPKRRLFASANDHSRGPDLNPDRAEAREKQHAQAPGLPSDGAVILIDEIDKAEADLPNDLLVPLGALRFDIAETGEEVTFEKGPAEAGAISRLLMVITTNQERDLPPAFQRRCVTHQMKTPPTDALVKIAQLHARDKQPDEALCKAVAERLTTLSSRRRYAREVSVAEYLDAVHACQMMGIAPPAPAESGDPHDARRGRRDDDVAPRSAWDWIERLTLAKG